MLTIQISGVAQQNDRRVVRHLVDTRGRIGQGDDQIGAADRFGDDDRTQDDERQRAREAQAPMPERQRERNDQGDDQPQDQAVRPQRELLVDGSIFAW